MSRHRDRGGGAIETTIVLPLLLICVFAVAHMAMYHLARQAALSAAQVAVTGQQGWGAPAGTGQQQAWQYLDQIPQVLQSPVSVDVQVTDGGQAVEATVSGSTVNVLPWYTHTVTQTARGPVERVTDP